HAAGAARTVGEVRRDRDLAPPADLHALDALVPAADHLALAEAELERVTAIPRRVELLLGLVGHADVVDLDDLAGRGLVAFADRDVLELELVGRRAVRDFDFGLAHGRDTRDVRPSSPSRCGRSRRRGPCRRSAPSP